MGRIGKYREELKEKAAIIRTNTQNAISSHLLDRPDIPGISRTRTLKKVTGAETDIKTKKEENEVKTGELLNAQQELSNEEYLERIIQNSNETNLVLKLQLEKEIAPDGWEKVDYIEKNSYIQQLPVAKKDRLFGSSENAKIKEYKKTFRAADLCTARELPALQKYFKKHVWNGNPVEGAEDKADDEKLKKYVRKLLDFPLDARHLTDDYLSQHITSLYDFSYRLNQYNKLKTMYPKFFASLSETERISLETVSASAAALEGLLTDHIKLHGIELKKGEDGRVRASLWKEPADKQTRHSQRTLRAQEYEKKHTAFCHDHIDERNLIMAQQLAGSSYLNDSDRLIDNLEKLFNENKDARELFSTQMGTAIEEIRRAASVREELAGELKKHLEFSADTKDEAMVKIEKTTRRIMLCAKHIDNYKEYISFLSGKINMLSKETASFLVKEKHEDLLEPVQLKADMLCLKEALLIKERQGLKKELGELLKKKKASKAKADGKKKSSKQSAKGTADKPSNEDRRIAELKEKLSKNIETSEISNEEFYEKMRGCMNIKKNSEDYKKLESDAQARIDSMEKRAEEYAKEHKLRRVESRTVKYLLDPKSEWLNDEELFYLIIASRYAVTKDTPKGTGEEIYEKGIKKIKDYLISYKTEDFKALEISKKTDFHEGGFWKNKAMIRFGMDMVYFLDLFSNCNIELSDDEFVKLKTFGKVAEGLNQDYFSYVAGITDPIAFLVENEKSLKDENTLFGLYMNIFNSQMDKESEALVRKYSKNALGYTQPYIDRHGKLTHDDVFETMANYVGDAYGKLAAGTGQNADYSVLYREKEADIKAKYIVSKEEMFNKEKERMRELIPDATDEMVKTRLMLKNEAANLNKRFSADQDTAWGKEFGSSSGGAGDLRSFKGLLRPVERDANGTVKAEYQDNYKKNNQEIEDYIAGGDRRLNVVKRMALDIIKIEITDEMLKPEYLREHFEEMHEKTMLLYNFMNISEEFTDFFDSDTFTPEERDAIRLRFIDNPVVGEFTGVEGIYRDVYGIDGAGNEIQVEKSMTQQEKINWMAAHRQATAVMIDEIYKTNMADSVSKYNKIKEASVKEPEKVKKIYHLWAGIKANKHRFDNNKRKFTAANNVLETEEKKVRNALGKEKNKAKRAEYDDKLKDIAARKNSLMKEYGLTDGQKNEWDDSLKAAEELKEFVYGIKTKEQVSDEAKIFASDNGLDYFTAEEVHNARLSSEKKIMADMYGTTDDTGLETKLAVMEAWSGYRNNYSEEQKNSFMTKFPKGETKNDIRCFKAMSLPVKRDVLGNVLPGYEENAKKNDARIEDYISGDPERMNKVLKEMAETVLSLDFDPAHCTEEYFKAHTAEVTETYIKLFNFSNFYVGHLDFFNSDAFTGEQKDELRRRVGGESELTNVIPLVLSAHCLKVGLSGEGHRLSMPAEAKTKEAKQKAYAKIKEQNNNTASLYLGQLQTAAEQDRKVRDTVKNWGNELRSIDAMDARDRKRDDKSRSSILSGVKELVLNKKNALTDAQKTALRKYLGIQDNEQEELKKKDKKKQPRSISGKFTVKALQKYNAFADENTTIVAELLNELDHFNLDSLEQDIKYVKEVEETSQEEKKEQIRSLVKDTADKVFDMDMKSLVMDENDVAWHIDELVFYRERLKGLMSAKKSDPQAFEQFSMRDMVSLEARMNQYDKLDRVIESALRLHGIHQDGEYYNGLPTFDMLQGIKKNKETTARHEKNIISHNEALKEFNAAVKGQYEAAGRALAFGKFGKERYNAEEFEAKLKSNEKLNATCLKAFDNIVAKYKSDVDALEVSRISLKAGILDYDNGNPDAPKIADIKEASKKLYEDHKKIEEYHDIIKLVTGEGLIGKNTEKLLSERGLTDSYGAILANMAAIKDEELEAERIKAEKLKEEERLKAEKLKEGERLKAEKLKEEERVKDEKIKEEERLKDEKLKEAERLKAEKEKEQEELKRSLREKQEEIRRAKQEERDRIEAAERRQLEEFKKAHPMPVLPEYKVRAERAGAFEYEQQTLNNCWCVAGTAMYNQFISMNLRKGEQPVYLNQKEMRAFVPKQAKTLKDIKAGGIEDYEQAAIDQGKEYIMEYAGAGKTAIGSIFEMADFFLGMRRDIAVNQVLIETPHLRKNATPEEEYMNKCLIEEQKKQFLIEVKKVLDTGNYVSVLRQYSRAGAHYTTIIGIDGKNLTILNPSNGDEELTVSVDHYIRQPGEKEVGKIELNYITKIDKPEELAEEYKGQKLVYDKEKHTFNAPMTYESAQNVGQTLGVLVGKPIDGAKDVSRSVYVPKKVVFRK
ncbi:MAG: hypothetical protein J6P45_00020 [Lachnospiraceae bacterium]|nr:hypothetical protein [Lachnospiraceae bacterium]